MTIESLLFLALFLALPLLDRLIRALLARLDRADKPAVPAAESLEPLLRLPPPIVPPPLPVARPPREAPRSRPYSPVAVAEQPGRRSRRGNSLRWHRPAIELRRAVVLMTILGPCRALDNDAGRKP